MRPAGRADLPGGDELAGVQDLSVSFRLPPDRWPGRARQLQAVDDR